MIIAVDFDGTIVEHRFPAIGKELPFAIDTLKSLQNMGHRLILWTYRTGVELENAVEYCRERGIQFYAINRNYPEEEYSGGISRKIYADVYIDDRNLGGLPDWMEVYRMLCSEAEWKKEKEIDSRKGLFKRLFDWN